MLLYDRIFESLLLRKAYHLVGGGFLLLGLVELNYWFFIVGVAYLIAFWMIGKRVSFAVLGILVLLAITGSKFTTIGATLVFWIGDGFAALVGSRFGRTRWPWNRSKSLGGSLAFFATTVLALLVFFAIVFQPVPRVAYLLALLTAFVGMIAETAPLTIFRDRKVDDNFLIILTSGVTLLAGAYVLGLTLPQG